ncbi:amidohydrolase family protein [Thalassotalea hakodatensis]|uniref:amidohydrolase family protein n=1 Tax=Thalassotalea hakodatensis TaxID=3030492 RepID=UPI002572D174|nr:amidohydrolase family protein [Thalassotalea hakodatensis]
MKASYAVALLLLGGLLLNSLFVVANSEASQHVITYHKGARAFINVQLIDGTGEKVKYDQTILVVNDRIVKIGDTSKLNIPSGYEIVNVKNHTVIPGFIGVHNHLHISGHKYNGDNIAKLYLAAGVTSIQTVGSAFPEKEIALASDIALGQKLGPEIIASGPYFTGSDGNNNMQQVNKAKDIAKTLKYWKDKGVKWIKVYRHIEPTQLQTIITEAHKLKLFVTGHLCSITFAEAINMGIDGIQHGLNSASDFRTNKTFGQCNGGREYIDIIDVASPKVKALQQLMISNNVFLTSTLSIFESSISHRSQADQRSILLMSEQMKQRYQSSQQHKGKSDHQREQRLKRIMAFDYQFYNMGGLLGAGVDAGRFLLPGYGDQRNFKLFLEAGFSTEQAIQVMTYNGARILKRNDIGLIKEGKRADFLILTGSLKKNPNVINNIKTVFKQGVGYSTDSIEASLQHKIGQ